MKRIALALLALLLFTGPVWATGSWSAVSWVANTGPSMKVLKATFTADSGDAGIPTKTLSATEYAQISRDGYSLCFVGHDPGSTGPTNGAWAIKLVGATTARLDISGGAASGLSSTVGQMFWAKDTGGTAGCQPVLENFAITITGNAVNSASATVYAVFFKP